MNTTDSAIYSAFQMDQPHRHNQNPVGAIRVCGAFRHGNRPYCAL
ncbi:MAG: hypothetical protein QNJ68_06395 [Microcoleaceae cyanobacterium MO_207.B10]|nr:hypothetical protein [Microcoleaceae cyanobacterium MO_207.B10]